MPSSALTRAITLTENVVDFVFLEFSKVSHGQTAYILLSDPLPHRSDGPPLTQTGELYILHVFEKRAASQHPNVGSGHFWGRGPSVGGVADGRRGIK